MKTQKPTDSSCGGTGMKPKPQTEAEITKGVRSYPILPIPKPRMTQRDKWANRPCVLRYRHFKDACRIHKVHLPVHGATVTFILPMPKSWSKKKRLDFEGRAHQQKPDLDNLIKALGDACYTDDSGIWGISAEKRWGYEGQIIITTEKGGKP